MIFDTHAHYDDKQFDQDREELLASMKDNGIGTIVDVGSNMETSTWIVEAVTRYPMMYGAVGVHPSDTAELKESDIDTLKKYAAMDRILAIGEIGLDYYWDEPERSIQKKWFEAQIELARDVKLPIIIHSRDAAKDTYDIMKALHAEEIGGVVHCFSYSKEMAQEFINDLFSTLRERMLDLQYCKVVFVGGGAILLKRQIETSGKVGAPFFVSKINANADGYEYLYRIETAGR